MAASSAWLAEQMIRGEASSCIARCTGDEINIHLALMRTDLVRDHDAPAINELRKATHPEATDEQAWNSDAKEALLRDDDIEWLWNPEMDGIEEDDDRLRAFGAAPMRVAEWFEPFGDIDLDPPTVPHPADYSWRRS